ncbi:MAG: hypothetical protein EG825_12040 [Rhodocyclaceae bacterium]|nr:hypothetical protein [Rhodocyclaceae bacterium]
MNANSVTSSPNVAQQLQQPRQQDQASKAEAAKAAEEAAKARQAQQQQQAKPNETEQPKPVVNTQGQVTGRVVNITA